MTPKTKLWCDQARSAGLDHLSTRCKDLINIAWHATTRDMTDPVDIASVKASLMIDVSQDILRKPWTTHLGTFTTSAQLYSIRLERPRAGEILPPRLPPQHRLHLPQHQRFARPGRRCHGSAERHDGDV